MHSQLQYLYLIMPLVLCAVTFDGLSRVHVCFISTRFVLPSKDERSRRASVGLHSTFG